MFSVLYLILATGAGWAVADVLFVKEGNFYKDRNLNPIWIAASAAISIGVLCMTWITYVLAWYFKVEFELYQPLRQADPIVMILSAAVFLLYYIWRRKKPGTCLIYNRKLFVKECFLYFAIAVFISLTYHHVLFVDDNYLCAGNTVFSDYAPHLALVRSFSKSSNYPTMYPHFGGQDIKYHFMFQFLTGNLEYLGLRIDTAYNLAGILFMWLFLVVLTQLAMRLWGRFAPAPITAILFFFRSGLSFFRCVAEHIREGDLIDFLSYNEAFIGYTRNEEWGLWNYNVYLNQRHLAFGLTIAALLLWYYLGRLEEVEKDPEFILKTTDGSVGEAENKAEDPAYSAPKEKMGGFKRGLSVLSMFLRKWVFSTDAWITCSPGEALLLGLILGLTSFWNGAAVIGCLLILLGFTLFSMHRLDYAVTAGASIILSFIQTRCFINGNAVTPCFVWGFIAEDTSLAGIIVFLSYISGITILGVMVLLFFVKGSRTKYSAAVLLTVVFTFTVSLTPDITVNHKYIMIAMAFLAPVWAGILVHIMGAGQGIFRCGSYLAVGLLIVSLTATGLYDFVCIVRNNGAGRSTHIYLGSPLTEWLDNTMRSDQMILTGWEAMSEITLSGKMLYLGWPYYAWSAGYDTNQRGNIGSEIYTTDDPERFKALVAKEKIDYIYFKDGMYYNETEAQENLIAELCHCIYVSEEDGIRIYETLYPEWEINVDELQEIQ